MSNIDLSNFNQSWQEAIAGHCMKNYEFLLRCRMHLKAEWFTHPTTQEIMDSILNFPAVKKGPPTPQELIGFFPPQDQAKYQNHLHQCAVSSGNVSVSILADQLTTWIKFVKLKIGILHAEKLYKDRKIIEAPTAVIKYMQEAQRASFTKDRAVEFGAKIEAEFILSLEQELKDCCTLGHEDFDEIMLEGAKIEGYVKNVATEKPNVRLTESGALAYEHYLSKYTTGSLVKGETTVIMGASNSGKTTFILNVAAHNLLLGRKVLLISHEDKWQNIKKKLMRAMTGLDQKAYHAAPHNAYNNNTQNMQLIAAVGEICEQNLRFIPWNDPQQMFIEDVISLIDQEQEAMITKAGFGFDLLINDYPGKLKSRHFKGSHGQNPWDEKRECYAQIMNAAILHNFHALLPAQANREGLKLSRGKGGGRMMDQGDIGGAIAIAQDANNVITINRTEQDTANQLAKYHVAKCRTNAVGSTFVTRTAFAIARTHGFGLPATKAKPGEKVSEISNKLLERIGVIQPGSKQSEGTDEQIKTPAI